MTYPISACVFIKNNNMGAFCLWESMASLLPFVSEFIVMDLGSEDGTFETLLEIEKSNDKVGVFSGDFPRIDAGAFADLANDLVSMCQFDNILYYQADEIWHQNLLSMMDDEFSQGHFNLQFWRIQFRENFQKVKWLPHLVHRVGHKEQFNFVGDGMNTQDTGGARLCSNYDGGWFPKWGETYNLNGLKKSHNSEAPELIPSHEMITDISLVGAFLDNIQDRRNLHSPFWHESNDIEGVPQNEWYGRETQNPNWRKGQTKFDIPYILKRWVGKTKYQTDMEIVDAIKANDTIGLLGL